MHSRLLVGSTVIHASFGLIEGKYIDRGSEESFASALLDLYKTVLKEKVYVL